MDIFVQLGGITTRAYILNIEGTSIYFSLLVVLIFIVNHKKDKTPRNTV